MFGGINFGPGPPPEEDVVRDLPDEKRAILKECGLIIGNVLGVGTDAKVYEAVFMEGSLTKKEMEEQNIVVTHDQELARQNLEGKKLAVKWMEYKYDRAMLIMKEVQTMDLLRHPNITKIIEAIWFVPEAQIKYFQTQEDNTIQEIRVDPRPDPHVPTEGLRFQPSPNDPPDAPPYQVAIVMEMADYGDILTWCGLVNRQPKPLCRKLSPDEFLVFARGLHDALVSLHQTNRVHSCHTGNILVFKQGDGVIGKLSDFGLSVEQDQSGSDPKAREENLTRLYWICDTVILQAVDLPAGQERDAKVADLKMMLEGMFFKGM